jgi:hypothetical protein
MKNLSAFSADGEQLADKSDYKREPFERYPDPVNILPISVDTCFLVPNKFYLTQAVTHLRARFCQGRHFRAD